MIEINSLRPVAIASIGLGISFIIIADYVAAGVWISLGITILLVEKVGVHSMNHLIRPEVFFTWILFIVFISLSVYQVVKDYGNN